MASIFKDIRFIALMIAVVVAGGLVGAPNFLDSQAVIVDSVPEGNICPLNSGDHISQIGVTIINDLKEYEDSLARYDPGDWATMVVNGNPFGCRIAGDGTLGFSVKTIEFESLNFGIDIQGGTRVVLSPVEPITKEMMDDTIKTIENRINFFGLSEVKIVPLGNDLIQIEMSGATGDDVRDFIAKQGVFEGKLTQVIRFTNDRGVLNVGANSFDAELNEDEIIIGGKSYEVNDTFTLDGETVNLISIEENNALLYFDVFTGEDIVNVLSDSSSSQVIPVGGGYQFSFSVQITTESAQKFAKLTSGQNPIRTSGTDGYIESELVLLLDGRVITELSIATSIAGQAVTTATISGGEDTFESASEEKLRLESTLRSGSLPVKLEVVKVDTITESSGKELVSSTIFVALASVIAVSLIVSYRYRDYQIVIPMVIISLSEILIVVGMAANQLFAGVIIAIAVLIGILKKEITGILGWITVIVMVVVAGTVVIGQWTIDIPVMAGLIAILGAGTGQMIIMTDQLFKEKGRPVKDRHKEAMQMIWSSAATIVFAMIPLILGGIGTLKGFAIATIIGILVGILITRPAYIAIIEKIKRVKLEATN